MTVEREEPFRRVILSRGVSFWAVSAIGLLAAATNAAASPLYRGYRAGTRCSLYRRLTLPLGAGAGALAELADDAIANVALRRPGAR